MPFNIGHPNILFLSSWYPSKKKPYSGIFVQNHALAVSEKCIVSVLHVVSQEQKEAYLVEERRINDVIELIVYYKKIQSSSPFSILKKLKRHQLAYKKGFDILHEKRGKFDMVHLNVMFPAGVFALHLKKKFNIPYIISEHWTAFFKDDPTKISRAERFFIGKIARKAELICPVSLDLKKALLDFGLSSKMEVVPNTLDSSIFNYSSVGRKEENVTALHVSNLKDEHKNISGMLEGFKLLSQLYPKVKLLIIGEGATADFKQKVKELKFPEGVISFESSKTAKEISEYMKKSAFFVLFSKYESFSVVIAEAMACGLPILTTRCGGLTEEIGPENGIIIPSDDPQDFKEGMELILDHLPQYNKEEISKKAQDRFSFEVVGRQFHTIYTSLLNKP